MKAEVGQVWEDKDKRSNGKRVRVTALTERYAQVERVPDGRKSRISLNADGGLNGYRLAKEPK